MKNSGRETRLMRKLPLCKNHVFGDFMPKSASSSLIKRCFYCSQTMGVKEFLEKKAEMKKRLAPILEKIRKTEHIDLFF